MKSVRLSRFWTFFPLVLAAGLQARELPTFDALAHSSARPALRSEAELAASPLLREGWAPSLEQKFGVPTFLWAAPDPSARIQAPGTEDAERQLARGILERYAPFYGLTAQDADAAGIRYVHDTGRGAIIVKFHEEADGIEVFREEAAVAMNRSGQPVSLSGYLSGAPRYLAAASRAASSFALPAEAAVALARSDLSGLPTSSHDILKLDRQDGPYLYYTLLGQPAAEPVRLKKVWFHLPGDFVPAYYLELFLPTPGSTDSLAYSYVYSARDGALLFRNNLTAYDAFTYRVWADSSKLPHDGPQGSQGSPNATGLPSTKEPNEPPFVGPMLTTLAQYFDQNDPWLAPGATETNGNNTDAYADVSGSDGFDASDFRASTTAPRLFDRVYDPNLAPNTSTAQAMAAVTQLFYDVNFFHDWYYGAGFNEAAGNAQKSNYGRGGLENDDIKAEAHDFSGRNNANMTVPADGARPRMQMYLFDGPSVTLLEATSPANLVGQYQAGAAGFGSQAFNLTKPLALGLHPQDPNDPNSTTTDGCLALENAAAVVGKIALLDRGDCTFVTKARNAQAAGAVGVLIANNQSGIAPGLGGTDASVTIPLLSCTQTDGAAFKANLASGVVLHMRRSIGVTRDGALDNQIVAHEWGHYISNRLIANASGLAGRQQGGMGEGWADFHALLLTVKEEDALVASNATWNGLYSIASYAVGDYYRGIRRYPYSTDLSRDPLTFRHISEGNPLPLEPPCPFSCNGNGNADVHNTGEVWATMLWECYASLLRDTLGPSPRLTFAEARRRMQDDLVAAYMMTPALPTFIEARDALLAAAYARDPIDFERFGAAFAKRGAGLGAAAPDRYTLDNKGTVESYQAGGDLRLDSLVFVETTSCDGSDGYLDAYETGKLKLRLSNNGFRALHSTIASIGSPTSGIVFPAGKAFALPATSPFGTAELEIPVALGSSAGNLALDFNLTLQDPDLLDTGSKRLSFSRRGNADEVPQSSATDDVEARTSLWSLAGDGSLSQLGRWEIVEDGATAHHWHGPDVSARSDQRLESPDLRVGPGDFSLAFTHTYSFEADSTNNYDGGVVELSADGGSSWVDIGASATANGYPGQLATGSDNPLGGRRAYVGTLSTPTRVTIDLGTAYANQTLRVRFRLASDGNTGDPGWNVDDIAFSGLVDTPFSSVIEDAHSCPTWTPTSTPTATPTRVPGSVGAQGPEGSSLAALLILGFSLTGTRRRPGHYRRQP